MVDESHRLELLKDQIKIDELMDKILSLGTDK
ncbi:hypothetical protein LCGC14_0374470 [marine sediment metagenome]|uniref:Uncharacterized protein n=1 Tax=marine sediment metagenome TaxID=412755 RepID=A0A0F9TM99_9ZZZZ